MENSDIENRKHLQKAHLYSSTGRPLWCFPSPEHVDLCRSTKGACAGFLEDNFPMDMAGNPLRAGFLY